MINSIQTTTKPTTKWQVALFIIGIAVVAFLIFGQVNLGLGQLQNLGITVFIILLAVAERGKGVWRSLGMKKEYFKAKSLLVLAPVFTLLLLAGLQLLLYPLAGLLAGSPIDYSAFAVLEGNTAVLLVALPFAWVSAAFGEEILFRGYLMTRLQYLLGKGKAGVILSILISSTLFGFAHGYQGLSGQIFTGMVGLFLAITYQYRKQDLWFNIMVHGLIDTVSLTVFYFGWHHAIIG